MTTLIFLIFVAYLGFGKGAQIIPLSETEKQDLVNSHNDWRMKSGATAMLKMKWNNDLAKFAESTALKCIFDHSLKTSRKPLAGFDYVGENIYVRATKPQTMAEIVDPWGAEIKDFDFDSNTCADKTMCGHYTQVVWAKSSDVGCAMAKCDSVKEFSGDRDGFLVFCNYGPGGNYKGETPFEKGLAGSKCQENYKFQKDPNGLCADAGDASDVKHAPEPHPQPQPAPEPAPVPVAPPNPNPIPQAPKKPILGPGLGPVLGPIGSGCRDTIYNCSGWAQHCGLFHWLTLYCRETCGHCTIK